MSQALYVTAIFRPKPECVDELLAVLGELAPPSRAEPGCVDYAFYRGVDDPWIITAIETWRDRAAFDAHLAAPHFQAALGKVPALVVEEPMITTLTKVI